MIEVIRREIGRHLAGVRSGIRAVVQGISIARRIQRVNAEGLAGESLQDVELMQQFGFTSALPAGAQIIVLPLGGRTSASVIIASEHGAYRLQLNNQGEAAMYNQWGDYVWLKKDGIAEVKAATRVDVTCPLGRFTGDVEIGGALHVVGNINSDASVVAVHDVADSGGSKTMAAMRTAHNNHNHTNPEGGVVGAANPSM